MPAREGTVFITTKVASKVAFAAVQIQMRSGEPEGKAHVALVPFVLFFSYASDLIPALAMHRKSNLLEFGSFERILLRELRGASGQS